MRLRFIFTHCSFFLWCKIPLWFLPCKWCGFFLVLSAGVKLWNCFCIVFSRTQKQFPQFCKKSGGNIFAQKQKNKKNKNQYSVVEVEEPRHLHHRRLPYYQSCVWPVCPCRSNTFLRFFLEIRWERQQQKKRRRNMSTTVLLFGSLSKPAVFCSNLDDT